jgi:lipoate-protein ligase A
MPTDGEHTQLWVMRPTSTALVMGSSQKPEQFDDQKLAADGVQLAARRSGGGAVFIDPASTVWIDVVAPRSSSLWSDQLAENFLIVGRIWQQAFATVGVATNLCTESPKRTDAATLACWAGFGWGELSVGRSKVVGLSQRRTRWGVRVQAMAVLDGSSARVSDYLHTPDQATVRDALVATTLELSTATVEAAVLTVFSE